MKQKGLTLLELLLVLTIVAVLLTAGVPTFSKHIHHTKIKILALDLMQAAQKTRTIAVSKNQRATLRNFGRWEHGWEIFIDSNSNGIRDETEESLGEHRHDAASASIKVYTGKTAVRHYISYTGQGISRAANGALMMDTLIICPTSQGGGYALALWHSGRMRLHPISPQECSNKASS